LEKSIKYYPIRRSTRLPLEIPLKVTSLDPAILFSEQCTTTTVNAHGCGVISPKAIKSGTRVQLEIVSDAQSTTASVLDVVPLNDDNTSWLLGMEMERAGNFWGIKYAPADWFEEEHASAAAAAPVPSRPEPAQASVASSSIPSPTPDSAPQKRPEPSKEIPANVLRQLLSECRLAAISTGGCYVQTGTTFPTHAPVQVTVHAGGKPHPFYGTVRVEHVGSGMGIEFAGSGPAHAEQISRLIDALGETEGNVPQVSVALAAPAKQANPQPPSATAKGSQYDALLALILVGAALKRSDFLRELEKQRRRS
jgi:hypothetical protein